MRIAYVSADPGVPIFGSKGCSIHVREMIEALTARGVEIDLISPRMGGPMPTHWKHVTLHTIAEPARGDVESRERACMALNTDIRLILQSLGNIDGIYERYSLWSVAPTRFAAEYSIPTLVEVNAPLIDEQSQHRALSDRESANDIAREVFSSATHVYGVTDEVVRYVREVAPHSRSSVLANGANHHRFAPSETASAAPHLTIGFVGSMKPWHGVDSLIRAFAMIQETTRHTRLLLVGNGTERERLEELADSLGIRHLVVFMGEVSSDSVPTLMNKMDIAVAPYPAMPSFYFCPLKVLEYMSSGCAVVASDIGILHEWITDGINGRLVEPGDPVQLAKALTQLCGDAALRRTLGTNARAFILGAHTWDHVANRILNQFHSYSQFNRVEVV